MKLEALRKLELISVTLLLGAILMVPIVNADPLLVSWYITVTDGSGMPVDGAQLTIYWATSKTGPFTPVPPEIVEDRIAGNDVYQNPAITGYFNPEHPHGMAVVDIRSTRVWQYYFYVKIEYDSTTEYWPQANSIKPGADTWAPVAASGSPSGYTALGSGLGNGPTTAYPNHPPPDNTVPEVPLGPSIAAISMAMGVVGYVGIRRRKETSFP